MNAATADRYADTLATSAAEQAMLAFATYTQREKLVVRDYDAAIAIMRRRVKETIFAAMDDAKEALDAGMHDVAMATFKVRMQLVGLESAKEYFGISA